MSLRGHARVAAAALAYADCSSLNPPSRVAGASRSSARCAAVPPPRCSYRSSSTRRATTGSLSDASRSCRQRRHRSTESIVAPTRAPSRTPSDASNARLDTRASRIQLGWSGGRTSSSEAGAARGRRDVGFAEGAEVGGGDDSGGGASGLPARRSKTQVWVTRMAAGYCRAASARVSASALSVRMTCVGEPGGASPADPPRARFLGHRADGSSHAVAPAAGNRWSRSAFHTEGRRLRCVNTNPRNTSEVSPIAAGGSDREPSSSSSHHRGARFFGATESAFDYDGNRDE